jgi:3-phosphoshikimate 1-carboxyvinyltransferase
MKINSAKFLKGKIILPGDKSISHRAAIFAALAEGETRIENFATSEDCASTLKCLQYLGVEIEREGSTVLIKGVGKNGLTKPKNDLDCGNSGTTMRLLSGVLAGQDFDSVLIGDKSLSKRPMKRIIEPLSQMNAKIEAIDNHAPLHIFGKNPLQAINYKLPVSSAQVKSCVLLAGLNANGKSGVLSPESKVQSPTSRDHTELMLKYLGAEIEEDFIKTENGYSHQVTIGGNSKLTAKDFQIPSDISSAAFFIVAAACLENSEITLKNVGLNPTRSAIVEVLRKFGAEIEIENQREICNEVIGDLLVKGNGKLAPKDNLNIIGGEIIANLIDEIPILAVFGSQIEGGLEIRNAEELRIKESDRISATVENLRRMNADVEEFSDGLRVGSSKLKGAKVDSYGDHRIAMAFAIAGLFAEGETEIKNSECVGISFPEFFEVLANVVK